MRRLSRFEKFGLIGAAIIACTFFYLKRVYEPQEARLKTTITSLNKVVSEYNNLKDVPPSESVRRSLEIYRSELKGLTESLEGSLIRTGSEREVAELLSDINGMIDDSGLKIKRLAPMGRYSDELMEWNVFDIEARGSFAEFMTLMDTLREMKDPVKIDKLTMEKGAERRAEIKFKLMI